MESLAVRMKTTMMLLRKVTKKPSKLTRAAMMMTVTHTSLLDVLVVHNPNLLRYADRVHSSALFWLTALSRKWKIVKSHFLPNSPLQQQMIQMMASMFWRLTRRRTNLGAHRRSSILHRLEHNKCNRVSLVTSSFQVFVTISLTMMVMKRIAMKRIAVALLLLLFGLVVDDTLSSPKDPPQLVICHTTGGPSKAFLLRQSTIFASTLRLKILFLTESTIS